MKQDKVILKEFTSGDIFVFLKNKPKNLEQKHQKIIIKYPTRLDAACTDPGKIYEYSPDNIYPAGQINFCADIYRTISVAARTDEKINIEASSKEALILHAVRLMQNALGVNTGFDVKVESDLDLRHCGLGTSAATIQGVGAAINELYGNPIDDMDLIRYLASNHGEEIDGKKDRLVQVQSVGGSGVCGHFEGGLIIMTGRMAPIMRVNLPEDLKIVFGVPRDFGHPDANSLIAEEQKSSDKFKDASDRFAEKIAYRLLNVALPELALGNYKPMKEFIFDYRWDMDSIKNCSYAYPKIAEIAEELRPLRDDPEIVFISLATAGPGFFIVTRNIDKAKQIFQNLGMNTYEANIHNGKYKIIERI